MNFALLVSLALMCASTASAADHLSAVPPGTLIDTLTQIDTVAPGLHPTANARGFVALDKPLRFGGGVLNSLAPTVPPAMRELVRCGVAALPLLIQHLGDKRKTKLTVGEGFFTFRAFQDEYDPKTAPAEKSPPNHVSERPFDGRYTVKVGDVCYVIIGQIVNRNLLAVRYQPSAILIVNSPIESPVLIERVKKDWAGADVAMHKASLIADAHRGDQPWAIGPALARLRFYYPDEYQRLQEGDLRPQIARFEAEPDSD